MKNITFFSGMLLVLMSSLLSAAYVIDFESSGGTDYGEIPSTYQPIAGLTISYTNVGVYSGSGTWNTFQYAGAGNGPLVFSFNKPVAISSVSLCQYDPLAATIIASAYSDIAGTVLLGTESVAMPAHDEPAGQNYVWQSFTGFAQYGQTIRRIEFNATGGINPNAQVDNIVIDSIGTLPGIQSLTQPLTRAIFQRNNQNLAMVPVAGTYTGSPTQIEARAIVMNGCKGAPLDWQVIAASPAGGTFNTTMAVEAGGWYRIEVRAVTHGEVGAIAAVERIGVGDVFITAGQSNSANWGTPAMTPANDIVSAWTGSGWRHAYDPQPVADGTVGGSPWSRLADMLVNEFDVPVGFISVGVGGTAISRWVPTANDLYPRIRSAISAAGPNGMRAILWHQGESDSTANTTMAVYASKLNSIIAQSRIDAGWSVPWGVALVAFLPSSTSAQQAPIRAGQQNVIDSDPYVFQGPDTDIWLGTTYRSDTVHFNALGLQLHAEGWKKAILSYFRPWDFDQDRYVDLSDFKVFSTHWLSASMPVTAYWQLNETTGLTATDSSGNGYEGTLKNGPAWTRGRTANALSLDGVNDYVEAVGFTGIPGTAWRTCMAWVKANVSSKDQTILSWGKGANGQKWMFRLQSTGQLAVGVWGGYIYGNAAVADGLWHHVAAVLADDGTPSVNEIKLYVDGIAQTGTYSSELTIDTAVDQNVQIGSVYTGTLQESFFGGLIDDVRIYNTALSARQISELYKTVGDFDQDSKVELSDLSIFSSYWLDRYKPNEARWRFDETTGLEAMDSSGNQHHGTLINNPIWTAGKSGNALSFDGVDDYVEATGFMGIRGMGSRTCGVWIKTNANGKEQMLLSWGSSSNGQKWMMRLQPGGQLAVGVWGGYIQGSQSVADGQWHHAAAVLADDGTPSVNKIKLYIDGIAQTGTYNTTQAISTGAGQNVQIGSFYTGSEQGGFFGGLMDDVRIYDAALTPEQVLQLTLE